VIFTDHGRPLDSCDRAQRLLDNIRFRIAKGEDASRVVASYLPAKSDPHRVRALLPQWLEREGLRESQGEISPTYLRELRRYATEDGYFGPLFDLPITALDFDVIERWSLGLKVRPKTRKNAAGALHAFLRWSLRKKLIPALPEFPRISVDKYAPRTISRDEQARVLAAIPGDRRGVFLALRLGIRPGEARALDVADFTGTHLLVGKAVKGPTSKAPTRGTKNRTASVVPVDAELGDWIREHRHDAIGAAPLFVNPTGRKAGKRWFANSLREEWNRAAKAVGLKGVKCYEGTKHSTATAARREGVPLDQIQAALRHRDRRSTERYAKLAAVPSIAPVPKSYPVLPLLPKVLDFKRKTGGADGTRTRNFRRDRPVL